MNKLEFDGKSPWDWDKVKPLYPSYEELWFSRQPFRYPQYLPEIEQSVQHVMQIDMFESWVKTRPQGFNYGVRCKALECPLATYLNSVLGSIGRWSVGMDACYLHRYHFWMLSYWSVTFVQLTDTPANSHGPFNRAQVLGILADIRDMGRGLNLNGTVKNVQTIANFPKSRIAVPI